ncbi:Hsp70 family protein [Rhodococcus rhodochrous]|uniref:Hsp70 family protein n=1 Tax=Rhodococcus rhodochrous TaxID=1829 RepID=A0AA46X187_RHORH|nr:Hsp70 family protein [Rhodococcus rhodochrous]UZF48259.1 Hsp70 family protein [Rhodococcus rhodochrous]
MSSAWDLSIDFGTSNTAAAHTSPSGNGVQVLPLSHHSNVIPSAVFVESPELVYAGEAALQRADDRPQAFVPSPKRVLGYGAASINGYEIAPSVLVAAVLRSVYDRALSLHNGQPPSRVVLTHPEAWSRDQIAILTDAGTVAGIDPSTVMTISEPRAAVHYYTRTEPLPPNSTIAVFDFGAGTLDVAVLRATTEQTFEVIAARGDNGLGGKNFDGLIRRWIDSRLADEDPEMLDWLRRAAPSEAVRALDEQVRRAKELLSEHPTATIRVVTQTHNRTLTLTREEFDALISDQVRQAATLVRAALADARIDASSLVALYLTGGSSRIPLVHRQLADVGPVATLDDPKAVVSQGALHAPLSTHPTSRTPAITPLGTERTPPAPPTPPANMRARRWLPVAAAGALLLAGVAVTAVLLRPDSSTGDAVAAQPESTTTVTASTSSGQTPATQNAPTITARTATAEGEFTPRGNMVGTFGTPMTSGCDDDVCDLEVTITGVDMNPNPRDCKAGGSEENDTVLVRYTVKTGPDPVTINGAMLSNITWSAVDDSGAIKSNIGSGWSGYCGDYESSSLMQNATYDLTAVLSVPPTHRTLIWQPNSYFSDLISAPGLEFSLPQTE